jgi:[CysO sulfur-carrier protein]-S-L-cysteine hydrolase
VLLLSEANLAVMVADCLEGFPLEACGLLIGRPGADDAAAQVLKCLPAHNAAASARVYTVEPRDLLNADRQADGLGAELIGVYHSHTHTEGYPSPTDIRQAPDPSWHYVLISLRDSEPTVRSYRIRDARVEEERVVLE